MEMLQSGARTIRLLSYFWKFVHLSLELETDVLYGCCSVTKMAPWLTTRSLFRFLICLNTCKIQHVLD